MTARPAVLVVDDEPQILRFLRPALTAGGYEVSTAVNGTEALRAMTERMPDAVLLDLGLPDMDGKTVIVKLRDLSDAPIIVLSARDNEPEKIAALDLGASDYVAKPFGIGEVLARLRVVLRARPPARETDRLEIADLIVDIAQHQVWRGGEAVALTPKEFELLAVLMRNAGRIVPHRKLLHDIWGPAHVDDLAYLRVFIGQLRTKIDRGTAGPVHILTEPGVGYRIVG